MSLTLSLLGHFHITLDNTAVSHFRSDKERALLAVLVLERERPLRRETLTGLFWGDQPQTLAFNNLRKTIHRLRQTLHDHDRAEPFLLVSAKEVQWNPAVAVQVDVGQFTALLAQSRTHTHRQADRCLVCRNWLETAVSLYQHNLLHGFALPDCPEFDEWVAVRREPLRVAALTAMNRLIVHYEGLGEAEAALHMARRLLALEPWQESAHRTLMRLLAASGERAAALRQYEQCRRLLATELDVEPEVETAVLYQAIKTGAKLPLPTPPARQLPMATTPFIGRQKELAAVCHKLHHPDTRLLTLVGAGGIGKTRLATAAAAQVAHDFPDGVWFVDLAVLDEETVTESRLVLTIATTLGLRLTGSQPPRTQLLALLKSRSCLLLLDNFETVLAGAALLAEMVQQAPQVVLLVTSREPLQLQVEQVVRLAGLTLPLTEQANIIGTDLADSVLLFQSRADRVGVPMTAAMLPTIAEICRFLAGNPLGIELAASWLGRLNPAEILTLLQTQADVLASPYHDTPARQRTLTAVFAGSWRLLTAGQQVALAQVAIFRGGFTPAAAQQVLTAVWADVLALVDKSLLRLEANGRYSLHELLRQFAAAQLDNPAEMAQHHSRYFLNFLAERAERLWGREPQVALAELQSEAENLYVGWQTAVSQQMFEQLASSLASYATYYVRMGLFQEGVAVLQQTLTAVAPQPQTERLQGWLHLELARLLAAVAQFAAAKDHAETAVSIAKRVEDIPMLGWAHFYAARVLWMQAFYAESRRQVAIALTIAQAGQQQRLEAECWRLLSSLADTHGGNFAQAQAHGEQAMRLFQRAGNRLGELRLSILLGNFGWATGDYQVAQNH